MGFADDFTVTERLDEIKSYWDIQQQVAPLHGYFSEPSKSCLIVKEHFKNSEVKLTTESKRHFGAVIGSAAYKETYMKSLVEGWIEQLKLLSTIAESEPQAA